MSSLDKAGEVISDHRGKAAVGGIITALLIPMFQIWSDREAAIKRHDENWKEIVQLRFELWMVRMKLGMTDKDFDPNN